MIYSNFSSFVQLTLSLNLFTKIKAVFLKLYFLIISKALKKSQFFHHQL